ncbi:MAG TPA: paraquat-inducible protein A [Steroidobacteraceae bacterium]|nr:paraquat-inducible protein A [Steroidobacteraceae bacterium]
MRAPLPQRPVEPLAHLSSEGIACPDCGLAQLLPPVPPGARAECRRCGRTLARPALGGIAAALALAAAALLLWPPACLANLFTVSSAGAIRDSALADGVTALWSGGFPLLAGVVLAFSILVPSTYLALITGVLVGVRTTHTRTRLLGRLFRWALALRPWTMTEVYLLGACVAYSRVGQVAIVSVGPGGWCLIATTLCLLLLDAELDERSVWAVLPVAKDAQRLAPLAAPARAPAVAIACDVCDLLHPAAQDGERCARCDSRLARRKPAALERTWALIIAGFLLYIPANLLPVLSLERFGRDQPNTILGGVEELVRFGLWPLAVIVFVASVLIPLMKLSALTCNLVLTQRRSAWLLPLRTRLHRAVDAVGRWSNIDVFMASILVALVQFGALMHVRADDGMVAFAAVVVLTMIAAKSFDSRLMWDAARESR